jgi:UDP-glucose 4-epimerase
MNILLTGATGFVGSNLLNRIQDNNNVEILVRSDSTSYSVKSYIKNIDQDSDYSEALRTKDIVVHCAARVHIMREESDNALQRFRDVNTLGTINLANQAAANGVKRFVFISTIKVNGELTDLHPFTAQDKPNPLEPYGVSKSEAEDALLAIGEKTGLEIVIIRPPLVYGPNVTANFASLLNLVSKRVPLPFGSIVNNRRSLVYVGNLVDLIVICLDHPLAIQQVFLVSDDHDVSTSELIKAMSKALNRKTFQIPVPEFTYNLFGKLMRKEDVIQRLIGSLQVDIAHTKNTLNWTPPYTFEQGLSITAKSRKRLN